MALNLAIPWARLLARMNRSGTSRRPRRTSVTALDVEGGFLHVAQAVLRAGQPRVARHVALALELPADADPGDPLRLGQAVAAALRRTALNPGTVVMGVPRSQVMLRLLDLPPTDREPEIAAMVYLRLSRDLPVRLDEALIDFKTLPVPSAAAPLPRPSPDRAEPQPARAPTRVLTAVVRRQTLEYYQSLAKAAGVKLAALGVRPLASAHAALCCHPEAATGCVALVSIYPHEVVFDVLVEGTLVFSRVGVLPATPEPTPAAGDPAASPPLDAIVMEVVRSLHSYEGTEGHGQVNHFRVTGSSGTDVAVADAVARQLGVPASVLEPAAGWSDLESSPGSLTQALPGIGLALGALEPQGLPFDFLNPKRPPVVRDTRRLRQLGVAAGVLAVMLTAAGLRARWIGERERLRADLQEQVNLGTKSLAAYRLVRNQARTVKDWAAAGRNWLDHLTVLSALLPPSREMYVTALSTSARNTLNLSVKIRSGETVDRLTATLRSAGYDVKAPAIMPATDRYGFRFQANLELEVPTTITNDLDALVIESRPPAAADSTASTPTTTPASPTAAPPPSPPPAAEAAPSGDGRPPDAPTRPPRNWRRRTEGGGRE